MRQQQKNTRAAHQVSLRQSSRILDETKQPFKPRLSNPNRCTLLDTRDEIDRGSYPQRETAGEATLLESLRDEFLLRRPNRQKTEPEWTAILEPAQAGFGPCLIANEIHRRTHVAPGIEAATQ